jgi:hypothetical protein
MSNAYTILNGNLKPLLEPSGGLEDNINVHLKEIDFEM